MKATLTLFFALLISILSHAGDRQFESRFLQKNENGVFAFEKVLDVPNQSKEQIYAALKQWVMDNVKTVDNNVSFDNEKKETIQTTPTLNIEDNKLGLFIKE